MNAYIYWAILLSSEGPFRVKNYVMEKFVLVSYLLKMYLVVKHVAWKCF